MHRFLWFPEVIEGIRRTKLHAQKTEGGIGMFDIQCKLDACRAEKFRRLASLELSTLSNIWEYGALQQLGPKIREINPALFSASVQFARIPSKAWRDDLQTFRSLELPPTTWSTMSLGNIYKALAVRRAEAVTINLPSGEAIDWNRILLKSRTHGKIFTNKERILSYRIAHEGFVFGKKKTEYGLDLTKGGARAILSCKFCGADDETSAHVFYDCRFTKLAIHHLDEDLARARGCPQPPISKDVVLYNNLPLDEDNVISLKAVNILKREIFKIKRRLDTENIALEHPHTTLRGIRSRTLKKLRWTCENRTRTEMGRRVIWEERIT